MRSEEGAPIGHVCTREEVADVVLTLTRFGGHLIPGETLEEGGPCASSSEVPGGVPSRSLELVRASDRPVAEVARSLRITDSTLHNWLKADRVARARAEDPDALVESEREELVRLRRENIELRTDREILRKAAACFARETMR